MDHSKLQQIVNQYEYGQFHLLSTRFDVEYNPWMRQLRIHPFFNYNDKSKEGTCLELMLKAGNELRTKGFNAYGAKGTSPKFFYLPEQVHYFLIVSKTDLFKEVSLQGSTPEISLDENQLVVDPSFKLVAPFPQSEYTIQALIDYSYDGPHKSGIAHSPTLLLKDHRCSPLGFSQEGYLVELGLNADHADPISIVLRKDPLDNTDSVEYGLHNRSIDVELKENKRLLRVIHKIRQKKVITTDRELDKKMVIES